MQLGKRQFQETHQLIKTMVYFFQRYSFFAIRDVLTELLFVDKISPGINVDFDPYPKVGLHDAKAYIRALDEMPKPCAALIAVPDDLHVEIMLACAAREIPFMVVKPAVTNLDDFYKVMKAMPPGLLGMVDYHMVYDEENLLKVFNNLY